MDLGSVVLGGCVLGGAAAVAGALLHLGRDRKISIGRVDFHIEPASLTLGKNKEEGLNGVITKRDVDEIVRREVAGLRELLKPKVK
jgi:hypothetical protein